MSLIADASAAPRNLIVRPRPKLHQERPLRSASVTALSVWLHRHPETGFPELDAKDSFILLLEGVNSGSQVAVSCSTRFPTFSGLALLLVIGVPVVDRIGDAAAHG
jgi:hypothetical protein